MKITYNLIILFVLTLSAFTVIYIKHLNRIVNIEMEKSEKNISKHLNEHKRLLDIKTKLLDKKLITENIKKTLGMEIPSKEKIIYLNLVE
jgi:cell division protein FtsL|tara:strand:- start:110 stop:379 length:270 start_codon:yes stop_codon:yes gene_type:complete